MVCQVVAMTVVGAAEAEVGSDHRPVWVRVRWRAAQRGGVGKTVYWKWRLGHLAEPGVAAQLEAEVKRELAGVRAAASGTVTEHWLALRAGIDRACRLVVGRKAVARRTAPRRLTLMPATNGLWLWNTRSTPSP